VNASILNVSAQDASAALREYRVHRNTYDERDWEIEKIYRAIARGKKVISVVDSIVNAGADDAKRPKLAIARANATSCRCNRDRDLVRFTPDASWRTTVRVPWPGMLNASSLRVIVPRIPPQHRPAAKSLAAYHILWEADWQEIPRDPMLLRRIGKDAWVVLAAWDLTDVEMNVLRAYRNV
jgi:hypothetical protein